jgi:cell division protein FtsQ
MGKRTTGMVNGQKRKLPKKNNSKAPKVRQNRLKKNLHERRRRWMAHLVVGLKLAALIGVLLGASALFMMGYAAMTHSDYFRAETIHIEGNQRLSEREILSQAGIRRGDNLLALNLRLVRERLLDHPWIASARVWRDIPETITIEIREQVPLARIDWKRQFLINSSGRIFKEAGPGDPQDLPLISGIDIGDISPASDRPDPLLRSVVRVLRLSQGPQSAIGFSDIERVRADPELGITLILKNRRRVKLGVADYEAKFERFKQLCVQLERRQGHRDFQTVDLTFPDRVVVQLEARGSNG